MERMVSPGVFTNEYDQSYLPVGVGAIGAAFVGPTLQGQAFVPTQVTSYQDFVDKFGGAYDASYVPYAVKNYLQNAGSATIVRVLEPIGYGVPKILALKATGSSGNVETIGVVHVTTGGFNSADTTMGMGGSQITSSISGHTSSILIVSSSKPLSTSYVISTQTGSANWIGNVLPNNPVSSAPGYSYLLFKNSIIATGSISIDSTKNLVLSGSNTTDYTTDGMDDDFSSAYTPIIQSQLINGTATDLFQIATLSHGNDMNRKFKISILNVKRAGTVQGSDYGSFSLSVRAWDDTDKSPNVLESYNNLTLDPDSANYIGKQIGDRYYAYNTTSNKLVKYGDYSNRSKYIRVEIEEDVKNKTTSPTLVPFGFKAVLQPVVVTTALPTASIVTTQVSNNEYNSKVYHGFNYDFVNTDNLNYLMPVDFNAVAGNNVGFNLDNYFTHASSSLPNTSLSSSSAPLNALKFTAPMQGGFDSFNPAVKKLTGKDIEASNMQGLDLTNATSEGSKGYDRAARLLSNQDIYDMNLVVTPGVLSSKHSAIVTKYIDLCESRGDCFYIFDTAKLDSNALTDATSETENYDTSYAANYYPWTKTFDSDRNKDLWVPASVVVCGAYSFNDRVGYEWYAPAGLNRGAMSAAKDVYMDLDHADRDVLYEARVNPLANFPNEGVVVWGQKTLQVKPSALDRVNVRRLLINLKKYIASVGKYSLFEANVANTRNKFLAQVNPYMENVQSKAGLYAFKIIMDESNNTAEVIDRNILYGQVFIQPSKVGEFLRIDFNVQPTGAVFGD